MNPISRFRVRLNAIAVPFLNIPRPLTFVGVDSSINLCSAISGAGIKRLMLITDEGILKLGMVNPMVEVLTKQGVTVEVFSDVEPDPSYETIVKGTDRLKKFQAEAVLAVGGGSAIDCTKAMIFSLANNCHPSKLLGVWLYKMPRKRCMPFYAIPTTAGSGSEVSIISVVSDKQAKIKGTIIDPKILPGMVALDPKLTTGLPPVITAPTGMDALTHAVESYLSTMANNETDGFALTAAKLIAHNLPLAYANGTDIEARQGMLIGSNLAGLAFTKAGIGYVHAISHQLGAKYHVPHGLANAIVMPVVLQFSKSHCTRKLADLARAAELAEDGLNDAQLADGFIAFIQQLNRTMQIPTFIKELQRNDFDLIISRALKEAHGTYGVPRYATHDDMRSMLEQLLPK